MKKAPAIFAAIALPFLATGCKERNCLEQGYDATIQMVREFNGGKCKATLEGDRRHFACPSGTLHGEVNEHTFHLELENRHNDFQINENSLLATCPPDDTISLTQPSTLRHVQQRLERALRNMEID